MRACFLALACASCTTLGSRVHLKRRQNHSLVELSESQASSGNEVTNPVTSLARLLLTSAPSAGFVPRYGGKLIPSKGNNAIRVLAPHIQVSMQLDDDELDSQDTSDSWDEQLAAQAAWEKTKIKEGDLKPPPNDAGWAVDEEAHFDFDDDDDDVEPPPKDPLSVLRQVTQAPAPAPAPAPATVAGSPNTVTLTVSVDPDTVMVNKVSLSSVLTTLMRIEEKVDKLMSKVDKLESAPLAASTPSTAAKDDGGWDGEIDEMAYFDDDPDDD
mmetsp:Transcript_113344/g.206542  ORF Transcript_113344/g.206542 Transcript_113344/m.206542 type:complete len:270 (-) Transcript_113344:48-857(-)